jgi:dihydrofolate reductase
MNSPLLILIAARGRNGVIGAAGALPWRLGSDLRQFRAATLGNPVVMGRKTWDSLGKALPGRPNLVVSRAHDDAPAEGIWRFSDLEAALAAGRAMALKAEGHVCVIGGGQLYGETIARADRLILTEVDAAPAGDAWFPAFEERDFVEVGRQSFAPGPKDDHAFTVRTFDRLRPAA